MDPAVLHSIFGAFKGNALELIAKIILSQLDADEIRDWLENGIDKLEVKAEQTPSELDDLAIAKLREVIALPDAPD